MSAQQTLKKWIPDSLKSKLSIYDFDNTLFNSHYRETGELLYLEKTGNLWPFEGWYGRIETLLSPLVPDPIPDELWLQEIVDLFLEDKKDSDRLTVLMTGRPYKIRRRIQEILQSKSLEFDKEFYRGMKGQKGKDTIDIKLNIIAEELLHDSLKIIDIYEDRQEHLSKFMTAAKYWKSKLAKNLERVIVHDVTNKLTYEI